MLHTMKTIALLLFTLSLGFRCRAADAVKKQEYEPVDGIFTKGEFIDLNIKGTERLYIRYGPISDSGVKLERTKNNVVVWRAYVMRFGGGIQAYHQVVHVRIEKDKILVTIIGFQRISEVRALKTGALISREVEDLPR